MDEGEAKWIQGKMDETYKAFGDRSSMAKNWDLTVSSAGEKRQHASKAIGLFIPAYNAIGVSAAFGDQKAGFTLSHEFAHFMDYYMAEKEGNKRKFVSHDANHIVER